MYSVNYKSIWRSPEGIDTISTEDEDSIRGLVEGHVAEAMQAILDNDEYMGWILQNEQTNDSGAANFLAETIVEEFMHSVDSEADTLAAA